MLDILKRKISRRIFKWIHTELSLALCFVVHRMDLWSEIGEMFSPNTLTYEQGLGFLKSYMPKVIQLSQYEKDSIIKRYKKWDPEQDTPEEIMERICTGLSGE